MVRPERLTRGDLTAVVAIVLVVLVGAGVIWWNSDARATVSQPAGQAIRPAPAPDGVPAELGEVWRAPSPATPEPVMAGPAAVTAGNGEVRGRNPVTGKVRWRFARDIPLCTVGAEWGRAIAVYRKWHNCSGVTSLEGATGEFGPQRNGSTPFGTRLLSDGDYVTATGRQLFGTWRSDLVRTQQYGIPVALKSPDNNMARPECEYASIAVGRGRVGVIEECPKAPSDRVTVLKAHPESSEEPEQVFTSLLGSSRASVVAVNRTRVAVVLHDRSELIVHGFRDNERSTHRLRIPEPGPPQANVRVESTTKANRIYWHTGTDTAALDSRTLTPLWTIPDTLGAGTIFADKLVVPVRGGLAVHDPNTGERLRVLPVDRHGYRGQVVVDSTGDVLLEQRGDTLVALR